MKQQNLSNHVRYVKGYHVVLAALLIVGLIASLANTWFQIMAHDNALSAALISLLFICGLFLFYFVRQFPLKVQDRAIRAEESLRYYILTRKPFDSRITMAQIIALRFAPDDEFIVLADRAVNEQLTPDEIKKTIKTWRPDNFRA